MRPVVQMNVLARLLILAWLTTWVATGPLFDTSLSDLPDSTDGPASLQSSRQKHFFHLSNQLSYSHADIALLDGDSKKRKVEQLSVLGVLCHPPKRPLLPNSAIGSSATHHKLLLFLPAQGPRAPPSVVSL